MQTRADDVIAGALILAKLLNHPEHVLVGVEDNKPDAIAALRKAAAGTEIQVVSFPTKYPSGGEKQLIQILTGQEVPSGQIPASIGVVCQNVGTAAAEIGRASCRERGWRWERGGGLKKRRSIPGRASSRIGD